MNRSSRLKAITIGKRWPGGTNSHAMAFGKNAAGTHEVILTYQVGGICLSAYAFGKEAPNTARPPS